MHNTVTNLLNIENNIKASLNKLNINNKPKIKFSKYYQSQISTFMSQPILINPLKTKKIPDGSPIGSIKCDF